MRSGWGCGVCKAIIRLLFPLYARGLARWLPKGHCKTASVHSPGQQALGDDGSLPLAKTGRVYFWKDRSDGGCPNNPFEKRNIKVNKMVEPGETKRYRTCDKNGRKVESRHRSRDSDFAECARTCRGRPAGGRGGTSVKHEKKVNNM